MLHLRPFVFLLWIAGLCSLPVFLLECFFFCLLIWEPFLNQRFCLFLPHSVHCLLCQIFILYFYIVKVEISYVCVCVLSCCCLWKAFPVSKWKTFSYFLIAHWIFFSVRLDPNLSSSKDLPSFLKIIDWYSFLLHWLEMLLISYTKCCGLLLSFLLG